MAYYSGKKIFSIVKTVEEHPPVYEGDYTITENGTYNTGGKKMKGDLTVNVGSLGMSADEFLVKRGTLDYLFANCKSVDWSIINEIDFTKFTSCDTMFRNSSIVNFKAETSKITNFDYMFMNCQKLQNVDIDVSSIGGRNLSGTFSNASNLQKATIRGIDNIKTETDCINSAFSYLSHLNEVDIVCEKNSTKLTNMQSAFSGCSSLTNVSLFPTNNLLFVDYTFNNCSSLKAIPAYDFSNVIGYDHAFYRCASLEEFHATGMKSSFDISASTKFTESALDEVLNNLTSVTSTQTITLGATNLAKLTDAEKKIATDKGWTLA